MALVIFAYTLPLDSLCSTTSKHWVPTRGPISLSTAEKGSENPDLGRVDPLGLRVVPGSR